MHSSDTVGGVTQRRTEGSQFLQRSNLMSVGVRAKEVTDQGLAIDLHCDSNSLALVLV